MSKNRYSICKFNHGNFTSFRRNCENLIYKFEARINYAMIEIKLRVTILTWLNAKIKISLRTTNFQLYRLQIFRRYRNQLAVRWKIDPPCYLFSASDFSSFISRWITYLKCGYLDLNHRILFNSSCRYCFIIKLFRIQIYWLIPPLTSFYIELHFSIKLYIHENTNQIYLYKTYKHTTSISCQLFDYIF